MQGGKSNAGSSVFPFRFNNNVPGWNFRKLLNQSAGVFFPRHHQNIVGSNQRFDPVNSFLNYRFLTGYIQ
jgi:hypothetical protein